MLYQSILPAMLALLVAHTLINSTTGIPVIASFKAGLTSDAASNIRLPWPSFLPGWGTLTVSRNLLTEEYDSIPFNQSGAWDEIPCVYTISRQGNGTCSNPYDFPQTHAIHGTLCLPEGDDYESVVKDIVGAALAGLEAEKGHCGCRCKCQLGCIGKLSFFFP